MPPRMPTPPPDPQAGRMTACGSQVRLPKLSLPRFKGNPIYWTAFWDSFESAVHLILSHVDKFNYLRSLLENLAYETRLTLSSANYTEAIKLLKKRIRKSANDYFTTHGNPT